MKIIFIGTGQFGARVLEKLANSQFKPDFLICPPDKPAGRKQTLTPCAAKLTGKKYNLEIAELGNLKNKSSFFKTLNPDIIIVADTNFILPEEILSIPHYSCLNVHPSLLPKYRGSSPIQAALLSGDREMGVTIIKIDKEIDHGPIVARQKLIIKPQDNFETLRDKLADLGGELLIRILPQWTSGKIKPQDQDHTKATFTTKLKKEDGFINWQHSAVQIERQVRALNPWPGTFAFFEWKGEKKRLKILQASAISLNKKNAQPGNILRSGKRQMAVSCGKDSLVLEKVQPEGKKEMAGASFLNGYRNINRLIN